MPRPLAGIQVLDLSRMAPGPFRVMLLADPGADVIEAEQRGCGVIPLDADQETSAACFAPHRDKRSILPDLKSVEERDAILDTPSGGMRMLTVAGGAGWAYSCPVSLTNGEPATA